MRRASGDSGSDGSDGRALTAGRSGSKAIPLTIPTDNYMQGIVTGDDPERTLARLDADWARLARAPR